MSGRREQAAEAIRQAMTASHSYAMRGIDTDAFMLAADAVLAALGDADTAQADAWDEGVEALRLRCEQMMGRSLFVHSAAIGLADANPYRAVVGDRAAAEGRPVAGWFDGQNSEGI